MSSNELLTLSRKARFNDLPSFSGQPSEDIEQFLKRITNLTKTDTDITDAQRLEIVRGKLLQSAGTWFDDQEFTTWFQFETFFRSRYSSTMKSQTKFSELLQRKQQPDEPMATYFNDMVSLCREVDTGMTERIIVQHLMNGVRPEFRKQLSRHDPQIDQIATFLTVAKKEQDIHEQFEKFQEMKIQPQQPYFFMNPESTTLIAVIHQRPYRHPNHSSRDLQQLGIGRSVERQQSFIPGSHHKLLKSSEIPRKSTTKQPVMDLRTGGQLPNKNVMHSSAHLRNGIFI
ncbi:unnamed protein product [Didymodactylos carnosus]|uniref:Retrotransposon gag domain-containing protein n=2 Tax=Didymodactylos carnosus TaxID=1234261 RepID=A0A814QKE9_9BILA|nr:unnamed protein product [Didymodactylos carnosus]CAF3884268.1 unnamed protein product [Didymodactylos carnosus]